MSGLHRLAGEARRLNREAGADALPALYFFTDPVRTPDPVTVAARLPRGAAVVYRHFGAKDRLEVARRLRALPGLILLIGADPGLAARVRADGVHLPERLAGRAAALKRARPAWLVTVAAHGTIALRRADGADAAVLSAVFPSQSASAGAALGARRAGALARAAGLPVIALGGVNEENARSLKGFAGLAAIDAILEAER